MDGKLGHYIFIERLWRSVKMALSGVVVHDSLIIINNYASKKREGQPDSNDHFPCCRDYLFYLFPSPDGSLPL